MSTLIQPTVSSLTIVGAFTQPGNGGSVTPTYTGNLPPLNTFVQLYKSTDGSLIGYYKVSYVDSTQIQLGRYGTQGLASSTSISAGSILIPNPAFNKNAYISADVKVLNSDSGTINSSAGWSEILSNEIPLISTVYQKTILQAFTKTTVTVDGSWRLIANGGYYSNEVLSTGALAVGTDQLLTFNNFAYINITGGNTTVKVEMSTTAGTIVAKTGTSCVYTTYLDE